MERTRLAYEELAGYLQLAADVYKTAKLVRRDLGADQAVSSFDLIESRERLVVTRANLD